MSPEQLQHLSLRLHRSFLIGTLPFSVPVAYLQLCLFGLPDDVFKEHLAFFASTWIAYTVVLTIGASYWLIRATLRSALENRPTDEPGDRLLRTLELPRSVEWRGSWAHLIASTLWIATCGIQLNLSPGTVAGLAGLAWCVSACFAALSGVLSWMHYETELRPIALVEVRRYPRLRPTSAESGGLMKTLIRTPRLSWYLPYVFGMFVVCTVLSFLLIGYANYHSVVSTSDHALPAFVRRMFWPTLLVGSFLAIIAVLTAKQLATRYRLALTVMQTSIDALAGTSPKPPDWVGTDELGDLAYGISAVFARLTKLTTLLKSSARELSYSAEQLSGSTVRQNETLSRQAAALQETEVTAQEINQTSILASQKTESVLRMTDRAEEISRSGAAAVEESLMGLTEVRVSVGDMSNRIKQLEDRARQIATITTTVKELADQSNMLALNAAIEAVRAGENGKGFSVVAREIRGLADQSIQATSRVREILQDITEAIRSTVAITERDSERVQSSLVQVQSSGESLRALSEIVRENASSVRQIAAAVGQQNSGVAEIFTAVRDLSRMMDETMLRVQASDEAAVRVRKVSTEVTSVVSQYDLEEPRMRPAPAEAA
jgi:methyl-accepting chemotaxis protein